MAPDGSWLATSSYDTTVRIWDTATWRQRTALRGHTHRVMAVMVAPDGSWLASGGRDKTVRIWDTVTWQVQTLMRLDSEIHAFAWLSNDGLAVCGGAGLYLFDFRTGGHPQGTIISPLT